MATKPSLRPGAHASAVVAAAFLMLCGGEAAAQQLEGCDSSKPSFRQNPPPDRFLCDETEAAAAPRDEDIAAIALFLEDPG